MIMRRGAGTKRGTGPSEARRDPDTIEIEVAESGDSIAVISEPSRSRTWDLGSVAKDHPARFIRVGQIATDGLAGFIALLVSDVLALNGAAVVVGAAFGAVAWVVLSAVFGSYEQGGYARMRSFAGALAAAGLLSALVGGSRVPTGIAGRLLVALSVLGVITIGTRMVWARYRRRGLAHGWLRLRTALVSGIGEPDDVTGLLRTLDSDMLPVARVSLNGNANGKGTGPASPPVLGGLDDLPRVLVQADIQCLLISGAVPEAQLEVIRSAARRHRVECRVLTGTPDALPTWLPARSLGRAAVISVSRPVNGAAAATKRAMDVVLAALMLIVSAPIMLAIAAAIKVTSPGPVTFRQWRVTKNGRAFRIVKFRTMHEEQDPGGMVDVTQPFFKLQDDPRLTAVGRMIRSLSLDELPQFWNVLVGEMSLVGPRPLPVEQVIAHPDLLEPRNDVRAGMTGWWQVNGRSELRVDEAVEHDLFYIENWSLALDLRIMLKTIPALLERRGAY